MLHLDHLSLLSCREKHGALVGLSRRALFTGYESESTDYNVLIDVLEEAGLPEANSFLEGSVSLVLVERNPTILDKGVVQVDLVYEHLLNEGQDFDNPPAGFFLGETKSSLQQKKSNLNELGNPIVLGYTPPGGTEQTQGGTIDDVVPQTTHSIQGIKITETPWLIRDAVLGAVNAYAWNGGEQRTWMCTAVNYKWCDYTADGNRYFMSFEFQHDPDTWDATAVYIDPETGKPPADLVEGIGYYTIRKKIGIDFGDVIGFLVEGGG